LAHFSICHEREQEARAIGLYLRAALCIGYGMTVKSTAAGALSLLAMSGCGASGHVAASATSVAVATTTSTSTTMAAPTTTLLVLPSRFEDRAALRYVLRHEPTTSQIELFQAYVDTQVETTGEYTQVALRAWAASWALSRATVPNPVEPTTSRRGPG
jgi:hypothetical protein